MVAKQASIAFQIAKGWAAPGAMRVGAAPGVGKRWEVQRVIGVIGPQRVSGGRGYGRSVRFGLPWGWGLEEGQLAGVGQEGASGVPEAGVLLEVAFARLRRRDLDQVPVVLAGLGQR